MEAPAEKMFPFDRTWSPEGAFGLDHRLSPAGDNSDRVSPL